MVILIKVLQLIMALSLLVLIHEFGHYIFARLFKIRVEQFYLFFPPAIFKYKPKKSDTEFGIGCIPLGGFCKISGMIDESMDKEALAQEPQPWEFRTRPAWQRLFVMIGGVLFNFIFAIFLYCAILFVWGKEYLRNDDAVYGIQVNELSERMGFRDGDRILAFDGAPVEDFFKLQADLVRSQAATASMTDVLFTTSSICAAPTSISVLFRCPNSMKCRKTTIPTPMPIPQHLSLSRSLSPILTVRV